MGNNKVKVSVVIPTYNIETYIGEMLECVARQTYSNMEVIVVNDGSTDGTLAEIEKRESLFKDIRIISIPNGGVSNARNIGIDVLRGDKIFFWDGDDTMEPDTIEKCVNFSIVNNVNAVLYGYANRINGKREKPHLHEIKSIYKGPEIREQLIPHFLGHSFEDVNNWIIGKKGMRQGKELTALWRIMVDTETIQMIGLRFDTNLSLGEDTKFINEYLLHEDSVGFLDECLYYLTKRETGANLTSINNAEKRLEDKTKLIDARLEIDEEAKKLYNINTHLYWEGTLVFSAVELAMRMSQNKLKSVNENYKLYKRFLCNEQVSKAIKEFSPAYGLKSIPFWMLKTGLGLVLFRLFGLLPTNKKFR